MTPLVVTLAVAAMILSSPATVASPANPVTPPSPSTPSVLSLGAARPVAPATTSPVLIWTNRTGAVGPSNREGSTMAYDPVLKEVILFGGWNGTDVYNDTWAYRGGVWTQLHPANSPPVEWGATMVWDPTDGYLVMFGGTNFTGPSNMTWVFKDGPNGPDWVLLHPLLSPQARFIPGMVWDAADGYVLLFAGIHFIWLNDTWTYLGGNWTEDHNYPSPPWRGGPSMAYDAHDGYVVLTNGESTQEYQDLWTYQAGVWTNRTATAGGSAHIDRHRDGAIMEYDPVANYTVVALGESLGAYLNDTAAYANGLFLFLTPSVQPPGTQYAAATWDAGDGYLLIFGGANGTKLIDQTWAYSAPLPLQVTPTQTVGQTSVEVPVTFSVKISGGDPPYQIAWSLGNGASATGGTVSEAYSWPGPVLVNVTVTDNASTSVTQTVDLSVVWGPSLPRPFGTARVYQGFADLFDRFYGNATGGFPPYTASWSFGDGTASVSGWNVTHTYDSAGTFVADLTVTDRAGHTGWSTLTIEVQNAPPGTKIPVVTVAASPLDGSAPLTVAFSVEVHDATFPCTYSWIFGDGGSSLSANTSHTYTAPGTYVVSLLVSDSQGESGGASLEIIVNANASSGGPSGELLGLPNYEGYLVVGVVAGAGLMAVVGLIFFPPRRRHDQEEPVPYAAGAWNSGAPDPEAAPRS